MQIKQKPDLGLKFSVEVKDWGPKKVTIYFPIFYLVKVQKISYSFTCILPDYVAHEIHKEF